MPTNYNIHIYIYIFFFNFTLQLNYIAWLQTINCKIMAVIYKHFSLRHDIFSVIPLSLEIYFAFILAKRR